MDHPSKRYGKGFNRASSPLIFSMLMQIKDPETGERLIDDPTFKAAAGIKEKIERKSA